MNDSKPIRDGFTFYKSFYESVLDYSKEEQEQLFRFIIEYALLGKEPCIDDKYLKSIFVLIKPNIDSSVKKYDQRKLARAGKTKEERKRNEIETKRSNNNKNNNNNDIKDEINNKNYLYKDLPPVLVNTLNDFEDMRKSIKKPITNRAREMIVKKLHEYSNGNLDIMVEILNQSIVNCWSNVYPLKKNNNNKKNLSPLEIAMLEVKRG